MRNFVYKVLILFIAIFFLYHFTLGHTIYKFQNTFYSTLDKKTLDEIKNKIREELNKSISKDRVIKKDDAILLNKFLDKIKTDLNNTNWFYINY